MPPRDLQREKTADDAYAESSNRARTLAVILVQNTKALLFRKESIDGRRRVTVLI